MLLTTRTPVLVFCVVAIMSASVAAPAHAYIGPGAGLSAVGTALALLAACFLAVVGFVWYPIKRFMRGAKARADEKARSSET
jgi:hypothetical protein